VTTQKDGLKYTLRDSAKSTDHRRSVQRREDHREDSAGSTIMITSRSDFDREMRRIDELIDRSAALPDQVFRTIMPIAYYVIDFDQLWSDEVFLDMQRLTARAGDPSFTFAVIRPDPDDYYHAAFDKFPFLTFTNDEAADHYITAIHDDPGESPADAIAYSAEVVIIYPPSGRWAIYGDRTLEIGILAVMDQELGASIGEMLGSLKLFTPMEAVKELLPPVFGGVVPHEVSTSFVRNYTNR
jgi:hypothetical protein